MCPKTAGSFSATILLPSSAASSPSPSIPLFIHCFNRPRPFIHLAIYFAFISLPQVSASLSSCVLPLSPKLLDLDIPRCCCRIGDCVQGYWPLLPAYVRCARVLYWLRRHCGLRLRRRQSAEGLHASLELQVLHISGWATDFISSLKLFSDKSNQMYSMERLSFWLQALLMRYIEVLCISYHVYFCREWQESVLNF